MRGMMSDRDMMQLVLDQTKHTASFLTNFIMECSNQSLRQDCMNALQGVLQEQHSCYELMQQRGWYQPMPADQNAITAAQHSLHAMLAQTGSMGSSMGMQMGGSQMGMGAMGSSPMMGYEHMGSGQAGMNYGQAGMSSGQMMGSSQSQMGSGQSGMGSSHMMGTSQASMGTTQTGTGSTQS